LICSGDNLALHASPETMSLAALTQSVYAAGHLPSVHILVIRPPMVPMAFLAISCICGGALLSSPSAIFIAVAVAPAQSAEPPPAPFLQPTKAGTARAATRIIFFIMRTLNGIRPFGAIISERTFIRYIDISDENLSLRL
jgi:hypothetical protein